MATARDAAETLRKTPFISPSAPVPIGSPGQWFGPDAYPAAAIRAGAQGRVVAKIDVDNRGRVVGCTVTVASGSVDLDTATCEIATRRMSFIAARDARGISVAGNYRLPVLWQLPVNGAGSMGLTTTLVSIGRDGTVLSCASVMPTPLGDLCGAFPIGRKLDVPETMRGKVFSIGTVLRPLAE